MHSNYNMACVTILAWWNIFASKWPRFWSKTNWKRFQRSWREIPFRSSVFTFGISFIWIAYFYWVILRGVELMWRLGDWQGSKCKCKCFAAFSFPFRDSWIRLWANSNFLDCISSTLFQYSESLFPRPSFFESSYIRLKYNISISSPFISTVVVVSESGAFFTWYIG